MFEAHLDAGRRTAVRRARIILRAALAIAVALAAGGAAAAAEKKGEKRGRRRSPAVSMLTGSGA